MEEEIPLTQQDNSRHSNSDLLDDCPTIPEEDEPPDQSPPYCWLDEKHQKVQRQAQHDYVIQKSYWNLNKIAHSLLNLIFPLIGSTFSFFNALYHANNQKKELKKLQNEIERKATEINEHYGTDENYYELHYELAKLSYQYFYLNEKDYTPKLKHYGFDFIVTLSTSFITTLWLLKKYTQLGFITFIYNNFIYFVTITIITLMIRILADITYTQFSSRHINENNQENNWRKDIELFFQRIVVAFLHGLFGEGVEINITQTLIKSNIIENISHISLYPRKTKLKKSKSDETFYSGSSNRIDHENKIPKKLAKETKEGRIQRLQSSLYFQNEDDLSQKKTIDMYNRVVRQEIAKLVTTFGYISVSDEAILVMAREKGKEAISTVNRAKESLHETKKSKTEVATLIRTNNLELFDRRKNGKKKS